MTLIIYIILAFIVGAAVSAIAVQSLQKARANGIVELAKVEAERLKNTKLLEVKEKHLQLKAEYEKQIILRNAKMREV